MPWRTKAGFGAGRMLEICRRSIADRSASGARQGYGVLSRKRPRNAHVTVAQRPSTNQQAVHDKITKYCHARPCNAHVIVAQWPSTNQQVVHDKVTEYCRATATQRPRDCRATAVDQSANGARQGYGVLSRSDRATPT